MAFIAGNKGRVILGDFALSAYTQKVDVTATIAMLDTTVLTSTSEECMPSGLKDGTIQVAGLLDNVNAGTTGQHAQIGGMIGSSAEDVLSFAPNGFALGQPVESCLVREASYKISSATKAVCSWTLDGNIDGAPDTGISLADLAQISGTTTGTGVDNAASTANGGAGFLHVTQYAGITNVVFKVQHSVDNSAWADLATFTIVTAVGSERKEVAAATTVNRYVRALATVTGVGTCTFAMAFARR